MSAQPDFWRGEKVRLRGIEPDDAAFFCALNSDSEMARCLDKVWPPSTLAGVQEWIRKLTTRDVAINDDLFCVIENLAGQPVGSISAHSVNRRHGTFRYGVAIQHDHRGRGYATEAIVIFLRYYFEELRYQKVNATIYAFNPTSQRLHEKLGFVAEGRLRRIIYTQGQYYDELQVGMTAEEFALRYGNPLNR